jgi:octaprenyl-diphosphate synthase
LEHATPAERTRVEAILRARTYDGVPFRDVLGMLERCGALERVKERALAFTERARAIMIEFPESPYQRALLSVTELVTERDR